MPDRQPLEIKVFSPYRNQTCFKYLNQIVDKYRNTHLSKSYGNCESGVARIHNILVCTTSNVLPLFRYPLNLKHTHISIRGTQNTLILRLYFLAT